MRGADLCGRGCFRSLTGRRNAGVATPEIGPDEALVQVRKVGVCGAGLKIRAGRMGLDVPHLDHELRRGRRGGGGGR